MLILSAASEVICHCRSQCEPFKSAEIALLPRDGAISCAISAAVTPLLYLRSLPSGREIEMVRAIASLVGLAPTERPVAGIANLPMAGRRSTGDFEQERKAYSC